ncbi:hypothetical protein PGTUg99_013325 [Puccinia graminis f. sp. tritici]|uniref:Uncharacterized protein n=1 Tax=Puccinia graminis f. sp. tritici TaxID=56615 RepID=A0A5B0QGU6_PUCGR|nr:hypothetical protein PGTUg99_013325 [Puccinia graminis f. sp. tritici]
MTRSTDDCWNSSSQHSPRKRRVAEHNLCNSIAKRQACERGNDVNDVMILNNDDCQSSSSSSINRNTSITLIDRISSSSVAPSTEQSK